MMETIIPCRNCDHPLKSGSCLGCNMFRLYEALVKGKLDWAKDEYNGIVESKLEQPTLSPDDVRGVGDWIEDCMRIKCSACGTDFSDEVTCCSDCYRWPWNYCPNCGARMKGD